MYKKIYSDLGIISIWITLTVASTFTPPSLIRTILAIPAILFIPGYVLLASLFPKKDDMDTSIRVALSFGVSIVIILLMGLLLNFTFGIKLVFILAILYVYTIIFAVIGTYIREKLPADSRFSISADSIHDVLSQKLSPKNGEDFILTAVIILLIVSTVGVIYETITIPKVGERYTEFYILNFSGDNYPTNITANSNTTLFVGIVNHEHSLVNYTFKMVLNKQLLTSKELSLGNDEKWERNVTYLVNKGTNMDLEFLLYKEHNFTIPYRTTNLWVNAT